MQNHDQSREGKTSNALAHIVSTPMRSLRFRDFVGLKVGGCDKYSRIRLSRLKELVPEHAIVAAMIDGDASIASCLRWILRGLSLEKAIRKVKTDQEVAHNAKGVSYDGDEG